MRRSVLLRFLGLSLAVALGAVIATAVIATYSTSEKLQGQIDAKASQLQVDGDIYARLTSYAGDHSSWSGVDQLVRSLADTAGRRVALTDPGGHVIADSARMLGAAPELPSVPAATIDARTNVGGGLVFNAISKVDARIQIDKGIALSNTFGSQYWGLTDEERHQRESLANQAATCYRAKGKTVTVTTTPDGSPELAFAAGRTVDGAVMMESPKQNADGKDPCMPRGLYAPSAKTLTVNQDEVRRATACLEAAGEKYTINGGKVDGMQEVMPYTDTPQADPMLTKKAMKEAPSETFVNCLTTAHTEAFAPYVAPVARLYLGAKSNFNVFSGEGLLRTAATALGVLLIAALVMVLAGRRLVRPILALTGAARRMTNGDHAARVPVSGRDEVARLGHAFNAMAESIQRHDHQRKAMVSDVAHELRTPLANIKGYLVASEDGVVPLDRALVSSLLEEAGLLERLVVDLQDLALADAGMLRLHPAPRDLTELVEQVVAAHRPAAETAGVSLAAAVTGPAPAIVDGARIRQALGNLVSNAIRFTRRGGKVVVGVRRVGDGYDLTVTDNGTGISAEHLPHLFDRFYRADHSRSRTTGGSGLGLAITKHLVEAHRGTITVTSTLDHGSTFTIHLPPKPSEH